MSCHDIGMGMNSVVAVVLDLYEEGAIDYDAARTLIFACRKGVHWCDGNEGEAVQCLNGFRCGNCLGTVEEVGPFQSLRDNPKLSGYDGRMKYWELYKVIMCDELCERCTNELLADL